MQTHPEDDITAAPKTMKDNQVRHLTVVDKDGKLQGILSIDDIVAFAEPTSKAGEPPPMSLIRVS